MLCYICNDAHLLDLSGAIMYVMIPVQYSIKLIWYKTNLERAMATITYQISWIYAHIAWSSDILASMLYASLAGN